MNRFNTTTLIPVAGGGTYPVDIDSDVEHVVIRPAAPITISADVNITVSGTPKLNQYIKFLYAGTITSNTASGWTVNIFGTALADAQALYEAEITALFDGSAWKVKIFPSREGVANLNGAELVAGSVATAAIANNAITNNQLAQKPGGTLTIGVDGANVGDLDASGDTKILVGDGTTINSVTVTGDVTISNTGVTTIGAGKVTNAMLATAPVTYLEYTGALDPATIADMYVGGGGSAVNVIAAAGAGKFIDVVSVRSWLDYGTVAYTGGGVLQLDYTGTAGTAIASVAATAMTGSVDTTAVWDLPTGVNTAGINAGVYLNNLTGSFASGDGILNLSILYRIIDFN